MVAVVGRAIVRRGGDFLVPLLATRALRVLFSSIKTVGRTGSCCKPYSKELSMTAFFFLTVMEIDMIENNEFADEYAGQLIHYMTVEQRQAVFAHMETLFDKDTIARMKADAQEIVELRADMDRRLAEMDSLIAARTADK